MRAPVYLTLIFLLIKSFTLSQPHREAYYKGDTLILGSDDIKKITIWCTARSEKRPDQLFINSLQELEKYYQLETCRNNTLPIDFASKSLLGYYFTSGGCSVDLTYTVKIIRDTVIYSINECHEGGCLQLNHHFNRILIPKIPSSSVVRYERTFNCNEEKYKK